MRAPADSLGNSDRLIVNELVTNAVNCGIPGKAKGTVMVTLKRGPGELRLTVAKARKPSSQLVVGIITGWLAGQIVQPGSIEK